MWRTRRKPDQWVTACQDLANRRREILVVPTDDDRVALVFPSSEVVALNPLQTGHLRGALRDAVLALEAPGTRGEHQDAIPAVRASA